MFSDSLTRRAAIHAALADPHRLAVVEALASSDRSPSELAEQLKIGSNLLAHHVDVLESAGVVERLASAGDQRRRYLRLRPEALATLLGPAATMAVGRVLFVCTANSARSQFAQALWNARHEVPAESAGTAPAPHVHPEAIRAAARAGLDLGDAVPRRLQDVLEPADLVVTVCDIAHEDLGDIGSRRRILHWSIPDPAISREPEAFDDALRRLSARVDPLAARVRPRPVTRPSDRPRRSHP
jgi:protein-tyrosine-phosphatase/DNA-binding HxlR family transcriptional regulator